MRICDNADTRQLDRKFKTMLCVDFRLYHPIFLGIGWPLTWIGCRDAWYLRFCKVLTLDGSGPAAAHV